MTHRVNPSVTRYTLWKNQRRRWVQWALAPIVILVIALGWKYPYLGYTVPVVMAIAILIVILILILISWMRTDYG